MYFQTYLTTSSTNLTLHFLTWCNYAAQLHPSLRKVKGKGKISPDQLMEKLKMRVLSWSMNGLEAFKVLNWLMSQCKKTIVTELFFPKHIHHFRNDPFLEIDSIAVAKICWNLLIFSKHCFCKSMRLWAHFRNTINRLHMNGTRSILAIISFMAVISWIANVKHQTCKSESVRSK